MQETRVGSLGQEDTLEKGRAAPGFLSGESHGQGSLAGYMQSTSCKNAGLDEAQAGIKIARWNLNNLRYADDTTLMAESEEELKSLLMKVNEKREEVGLKLNIQKTKIMASGPISS